MADGYTEPRSNWGTMAGGDMIERPTVHRKTFATRSGKPSRVRYHMDTAPGNERSRIAAIWINLEDAQDDFVYLAGGCKIDAVTSLFDGCDKIDAVTSLFDGCDKKTKALIVATLQAKLMKELTDE